MKIKSINNKTNNVRHFVLIISVQILLINSCKGPLGPEEVNAEEGPVIELINSTGYCEVDGNTIYSKANMKYTKIYYPDSSVEKGEMPHPRIYFVAKDTGGWLDTTRGCRIDIDNDGKYDSYTDLKNNPDSSYFQLTKLNFPGGTIEYNHLYEDIKIWCWDNDSNKTEVKYDLYIEAP